MDKIKVLFLDIDGVVNCSTTCQRHRGGIGIDPYMAFLVGKITIAIPDLKIVLSSTWRLGGEAREEVFSQVTPFFDVTPDLTGKIRGEEIKDWLDRHHQVYVDVEKYAILDDDKDMLPEQLPNFFQTTWKTGLTEDIMNKVIKHLSEEKICS